MLQCQVCQCCSLSGERLLWPEGGDFQCWNEAFVCRFSQGLIHRLNLPSNCWKRKYFYPCSLSDLSNVRSMTRSIFSIKSQIMFLLCSNLKWLAISFRVKPTAKTYSIYTCGSHSWPDLVVLDLTPSFLLSSLTTASLLFLKHWNTLVTHDFWSIVSFLSRMLFPQTTACLSSPPLTAVFANVTFFDCQDILWLLCVNLYPHSNLYPFYPALFFSSYHLSPPITCSISFFVSCLPS